MSVLRVKNLTKRSGEQTLLHDIEFNLDKGEILAIKGLPGAGIDVLLQVLAGQLIPSSGTICYFEKIIKSIDEIDHNQIGILLRNYAVYDRMTVKQYLDFFRKLYGLKKQRVDEVCRKFGLLDRQNDRMNTFSDSLMQRVKMAKTILHNPKILLLDEPSQQVDLETRQILRNTLFDLAEQGISILLTTSSSEEADSLADRVGKMKKGRIIGWYDIDKKYSNKEEINDVSSLKIDKIPAKVNDKIILFDPQELIHIEAHDGKAILYSDQDSYKSPLTLSELEIRLKPFGFFRSHRSCIVNLQRVKEVVPWTRNSYSLVLDDVGQTTVPLSKNNYSELQGILGI